MKIARFSPVRDKFLRVICVLLGISSGFPPVSAHTPYAEDLLAEMQRPTEDPCPAWQQTHEPLTQGDARLLSCNLLKEVELAREFPNHATRARNDVVIAWLLERGVPFAAVGRVYIFHQDGAAFRFENARFLKRFSRDWQMVFGSMPRKVELVDYEKRFVLDMSGENTLASPYEAVAVKTGQEWRVLDTSFLPETLSVKEWQKRLRGEKAVVALAGLDTLPELVVALLPERPKERLRRTLALEKHMPWNPQRVEEMVQEMPESMRLQVYADVLEFWEANPLYPLRWQKDSLGWEEAYPWQETDNQQRLDKAFMVLSSLLGFKRFWVAQENDEAMLIKIKEQMERASKRKDRVEFDLRIVEE